MTTWGTGDHEDGMDPMNLARWGFFIAALLALVLALALPDVLWKMTPKTRRGRLLWFGMAALFVGFVFVQSVVLMQR
jgi:drug/metabolite transporter (DMT)-like permease